MAQVRVYTTWEQRVFGQVMAAFAGIALLLAVIGVYGLVAYAVSRRTREIGVRMALGARPSQVMRMVVGNVGTLAAAGGVLGLLFGAAMMRLVESLAFAVNPRDPAILVGATGAMVVAVFAAAFWPARKATRLEPVIALRCD